MAGVVTDQRGDPVRGSDGLIDRTCGRKSETCADRRERILYRSGGSGIFDLQVSAPGFATRTVHGELGGNQQLDLGKLVLTIQSATVEVTSES